MVCEDSDQVGRLFIEGPSTGLPECQLFCSWLPLHNGGQSCLRMLCAYFTADFVLYIPAIERKSGIKETQRNATEDAA